MSEAGPWRKSHRSAGDFAGDTPLQRTLVRIVDGALAGCIFLVPLLMGGRQALGQLVLVTLALVVTLAWILRQILAGKFVWRWSSAEWLLAAGVLLLLVQVAPLPKPMLASLAPNTAEVLPLWSAEGTSPAAMGAWSCVSLTPNDTRTGLALLLAYGLLFLVTVQRTNRLEDVERLLRWIAFSALLMASFGLVQLFGSNGRFFWFYEHPFSDTFRVAKGSFTNRNHFAHFLALGLGPLIWWLQDGLRRRHRQGQAFGRSSGDFRAAGQLFGLRSVALGVVLFAGLLSLSRGGAVVMAIAAVICVGICFRAKRLGIRSVLSLVGVALLIGTLLAVHGYDRVSDRLNDLSAGSIDAVDQASARRTIWSTVLEAIPDYAICGSGVGSFREVYPRYLENPPDTECTHAENGPLQVLLETGIIGLVLLLAGIGLCVSWCCGSLKRAGSDRLLVCAGAITAGLAVSLAHSLFDFVWYVPACTALVAVLAGCACRTRQMAAEAAQGESAPRPRFRQVIVPKLAAAAAGLALAILGAGMIAGRIGPALAEPHWDCYRIMSLVVATPEETAGRADRDASPEKIYQASLDVVGKMIAELEQVVRHDPNHARAHLRLTAAYLRRFDLAQQTAENVMPLMMIRDAAIRAYGNSSAAEVDAWLDRALEERRANLDLALEHARRGLELCPLQGEGYLYLAELSFLEGPCAATAKAGYIDQALRVRGYDGDVLFEAGREAFLAGYYREGLQYWQRSFRAGARHQKQLIDQLAGRVAVGFFLQGFQVELPAIRLLEARYAELARPEQIDRLRWLYREIARSEHRTPGGDEAARAWLQGQLVQIRRPYAELAVARARDAKGDAATRRWAEAARVYRRLGDVDNAVQCARNAFASDPNHYDVRYLLASCLIDQQQYAEAERHLRWCLERRPARGRLQQELRRVVKMRIDKQGRTAYRAKASELLR